MPREAGKVKLLTAVDYYAKFGVMPKSNHAMVSDEDEWLGDVSQSDHDPSLWTITRTKTQDDFISFVCPLSSIYDIFRMNFPGE
jgi:hypothetical protein